MNKSLLSIVLAIGITACTAPTKEVESETPKTVVFPLSNLDTTASPCEDFYQYAIGGWLKENPVPSTESRWSSFNIVRDANNAKLKKILIEFSEGKFEEGSTEQKIGDFYKSAMDSARADDLGLEPLNTQLSKIDEITSIADLIELSANFRKLGVGSLYSLYVGQDDKKSDEYITYLSQGGLGLPDQAYYTNKDEKSVEIQEAYKVHLSKMFRLMGDENTDDIANRVYNIEKQLAEVSMTRVERRDPDKTYNKMDRQQLDALASQINWENYFTTIGLNDVSDVIVSQPDFMKGLNSFFTSISIDDWKLYMRWKLVDAFASDLSSDFVNQNFDFFGKTLSGTKEMKPRWERALSKVNRGIGRLVGKAFVERHFPEESKGEVRRMVENLRSVFIERVKQLEWMGEETKTKAIEKLHAFNMKIGYPDKWRDYSSLEIVPDNQVQNVMNARQFNFNYMINKLGKEIDKDEWFMTPQTVNAYYSSSKNEIVFPAGILQPPFYSPDADDALNYGGIGAVIGHEFTHGFDDQGSKYDAKGNLENWWTDEDRERFEARADKVVEQFNGFEPLEGLHVNGRLTLGENIADLGGITLAYYALEKEYENKEKPADIDGFSYQQRFFLGWAQVWHMNMTEEELRRRITTDSHSPGEYRVKGPLANFDEFAAAFGCSSGQTMVNNDTSKAVIW